MKTVLYNGEYDTDHQERMRAVATQNEAARGWLTRFGVIWLGQAASLIGSALAHFALVWWVTETTGSATALATASLVAMLPGILLGPFAGALVDRWNRRVVMVVADGVIALASAWLAWLLSRGIMDMWHVYVALMVRSLAGSFHMPAMQASTALMVPKAHLTRVSGLNQAIRGAVDLAAPPLGALLLSLMPLHNIMLVDVGTAALAILPLLVMAVPQPERTAVERDTNPARALWRDVRFGLAYVMAWRALAALILLATCLNLLFSPAFALLPLLVTQHLGGGPPELAAIQSAFGAGVIVGGLLLGAWGGFRKRLRTVLVGVVGTGLGGMTLAAMPPSLLALGLGGMLVAGVMNSMCNGAIQALMQERVDPAVQGRVLTVMGSLARAMSPIGLAIVGPVADLVGVRTVMLAGTGGAALLGLSAFGWRVLRGLETEPGAHMPVPLSEGATIPDP